MYRILKFSNGREVDCSTPFNSSFLRWTPLELSLHLICPPLQTSTVSSCFTLAVRTKRLFDSVVVIPQLLMFNWHMVYELWNNTVNRSINCKPLVSKKLMWNILYTLEIRLQVYKEPRLFRRVHFWWCLTKDPHPNFHKYNKNFFPHPPPSSTRSRSAVRVTISNNGNGFYCDKELNHFVKKNVYLRLTLYCVKVCSTIIVNFGKYFSFCWPVKS